MSSNTPNSTVVKTTNFINLLCAVPAVAIAELVTLPICTIKTNFQNTTHTTLWQTIKHIYAYGGWKAFFRASYPAVLSQTFSTSSKYVSYRYISSLNLLGDNPICNSILSSILSGIGSSLVTHPMDFIKIHYQMCEKQNETVWKKIVDSRGKSLYNGYSKTFGKVVLGSILFFPMFDYFHTKTSNAVLSSALTAILATIIIHPVDFLKTRQIYGLDIFRGVTSMTTYYYKGLTANMARIVPHFIITMSLVEYFRAMANKF